MFSRFFDYLRERQPPMIRHLHLLIALMVIGQIIASNFIKFSNTGGISEKPVAFYGSWMHIGEGLILAPLALLLVVVVLKRNGFRHFFPYLSGDFSQLLGDIRTLASLRLPEPSPGGWPPRSRAWAWGPCWAHWPPA